MTLSRLVLAVLTLSAVSPSPHLGAEEPKTDWAALYKKCVKSCVFLTAKGKDSHSTGTGTLIDAEQRLVLTSFAVAEDVDTVFAQFPVQAKDGAMMVDKQNYLERVKAGEAPKGKVLFRDRSRDLALIQLDKVPAGTPALPLAKEGVATGDPVMVIGHPETVDQVFGFTPGKVRSVAPVAYIVPGPAGEPPQRFRGMMVTSTNPNSLGGPGGPMLDRRGHLVAVEHSWRFPGSAAANTYLAVTEVRAFLAEKKVTIKEAGEEPTKPAEKKADQPAANEPKFDGPALYKKCVQSVAFLYVPREDGAGEGSGTLIDADQRLLVTAHAFLGDGDTVFAQFPTYKDGDMVTDQKRYVERVKAGQALKGKVLFRDKTRDLALIQLDKLPAGTPALPLGKESVAVGETVIQIGNFKGPPALAFSTTRGEVRAVGRRDFVIESGPAATPRQRCMIVAATNPVGAGDSGGPLLDRRGYLVAVTRSEPFLAHLPNSFTDVTEVRAFLEEKKVNIADPPAAKDPKR